jgi:hypothetical protein
MSPALMLDTATGQRHTSLEPASFGQFLVTLVTTGVFVCGLLPIRVHTAWVRLFLGVCC